MFRVHTIALAGALCAVATSIAVAQQAPPAPAKSKAQAPSIVIPASPAPKPTTKTLSGSKAAPGGKVLTREELRACMKRQDNANTVGKDLQQRRVVMEGEKDELLKSGEALKALRADVETKLAAVREWEGRMRAHATEIEDFNRKTKAVEEAPRNQREALSKALEADRENLNKVRVALTEEEGRLVPVYEAGVRTYNERALARDAVVADWNARNKVLNDSGTKHENERTDWLNDCANRPYREDDEIAIKAGK